jgi:ADP-ribose pyrophosphatase YjhB (NUDIX family)
MANREKDDSERAIASSAENPRVIPENERLVKDDYSFDLEGAVARACRAMYPGYVPLGNRLRMTEDEIREWVREGMLYEGVRMKIGEGFPLGVNALFDHPNRLSGLAKGRAIGDDGEQDFRGVSFLETFDSRGYFRDSRGVPVHPSFRTMLSEGAIVGPGFYFEYGPNRTADPIVIREMDERLELLVIKRTDTGRYAIPGGMIEAGEEASLAAKRELREETGVDLGDIKGEIVYAGVIADPRATLNAWPEATTFLYILSSEQTKSFVLEAQDDADQVLWVDASEVGLSTLFASHADSVKMAIKFWQGKSGLVVDKTGRIGRRE